MKLQWNRLLIALSLGIYSSLGFSARIQPDAKTTALAFLMAENPVADTTSQKVQARLTSLEAEVGVVFEAALTAEGQAVFYQPTPVVFGDLSLRFDKATAGRLALLPQTDHTIDLTKQLTGIAQLDALNAKYGAIKMRLNGYGGGHLNIDPKFNPNLVALEYKAVPGMEYAEGNHVWRFNGGVQRMAGFPVLYRFTFGWGDCPAGCIANHHMYYELFGHNQVTKLAESGNPVNGVQEAEKIAGYFKN